MDLAVDLEFANFRKLLATKEPGQQGPTHGCLGTTSPPRAHSTLLPSVPPGLIFFAPALAQAAGGTAVAGRESRSLGPSAAGERVRRCALIYHFHGLRSCK